MTGKTSNEGISNEIISMAPMPLNNAPAPGKIKSMPAAEPPRYPEFSSSSNMVTSELRTIINKKWEACWPINMLRPLVLLDLISYLLFLKKIEERQLITSTRGDEPDDHSLHVKESDELRWSSFKKLDAQNMHHIFTKEKGVTDLIKNYSHSNLPYSVFLKEPLLLTPTASLLSNLTDVIKLMESEDTETAAAIFEYLLNKAEIAGQNGQVYAPDYVIKLIVSMMKPEPGDLIGDPSAGNASLLVNSAMYMAGRDGAAIPDLKSHFDTHIYKGIESDLVQARIGAMNMILHGIEDPKLEVLNVFSKTNLSLREQPTLILSNLFFEGIDDKTVARANTSQSEIKRPEIRFLKLILKNLKKGGRAAVIVREILLYDNITEIKTIRQQIIDDYNLEGVISLPATQGALFSGACILIFTNEETDTTDKVWFYKMDARESTTKKDTNGIAAGKNGNLITPEQHPDVADILMRWKNEKEEAGRKRSDKSFYVPVGEIKENHYNLVFNEYRKSEKEPEVKAVRHIPVPVIEKEIEPEPFVPEEQEPAPPVKKIRPVAVSVQPKKRSRRVLISILVICLVAAGLAVLYFKNKDDVPDNQLAKNSLTPNKPTSEQTTRRKATSTPAAGMLTSEQIKAILKDTTGILHFNDQVQSVALNSKRAVKTPVKKNDKPAPPPVVIPDKTPEPVAAAPVNPLKIQYTVTDTTFFHDEPDESTKRKSFLDPLNKNVLNPLDEKNGFIYIVYTNHFGRTSKGWINKKDLKPLH